MRPKTAIVTGGSSGIGLATCERLAERGVEVFSVSRRPSPIRGSGLVHDVQLDLADLNEAEGFAKSFSDDHGVPDLLINNAGYGAFFEWKAFPREEITRQCSVLFSAPVLFCRQFAPQMADEGKGVVVNVTSLATLYPLPYMPLYNACKSALSSLTRTLMLEYPCYPRFVDFRLGDVSTSFNQSAPKQSDARQTTSMKRAWQKIEDQLNHSPSPEEASLELLQVIDEEKYGVFYGGGFFQARVAPFLHRMIPDALLRKVLRARYGMQ